MLSLDIITIINPSAGSSAQAIVASISHMMTTIKISKMTKMGRHILARAGRWS